MSVYSLSRGTLNGMLIHLTVKVAGPLAGGLFNFVLWFTILSQASTHRHSQHKILRWALVYGESA